MSNKITLKHFPFQKRCLNGIFQKCLARFWKSVLVFFSLIQQSAPTVISTLFFVPDFHYQNF